MTLAEDPSVRSGQRKSAPYCVVQLKPHTMSISVDRIHNGAAVDRVLLANAANGGGQQTEKLIDETPFAM